MIYKKIILVGNPNTGKTTLFNSLTKSFEKVSNWHGVTVGVKEKKVVINGKGFIVVDLPGIYSLAGYSSEEKIAINYLKNHKNDLIINICDANNIKRNLLLTTQLINNGYNIVVALNMYAENKNCNYANLSIALGVKVINIDARKPRLLKDLITYCNNCVNNKKSQKIDKNDKIYYQIIRNNEIFAKNKKLNTTDIIDKFLLNKIIFIPLFLIIILAVFYITFGSPGSFVGDIINIQLNKIANVCKYSVKNIINNAFIRDFINVAIIDSVVSVFSFLPQIVLLITLFSIIEDIGLMPRFAFMFDGLLKKLGLTGKSLLSIFMGFGCSTSAIITTKNLENKELQKSTVCAIPFIPCSAKLPVILVIVSLFFDRYKFLFVFLLYLFSIFVSIVVLFIRNKKIKTENIFILEIPKIRMPDLKKISRDIYVVIYDFLAKTLKIILFFSIIVWILQNLSLNFSYLNNTNFEKSLLFYLVSKITFLFEPIGLNNVGIIISLVLGLCAKEMIVVGLYMINSIEPFSESLIGILTSSESLCYFNETTSIIFLIFILLYSPCISSLAVIKGEFGLKYMLKYFLFQILIAYFCCLVVYICLTNFNLVFFILTIFILVILVRFMLKLSKERKIKCKGDCCACRKI